MKIDKNFGLVSGGYELKLIAKLNRKVKKQPRKHKRDRKKRKYTREVDLGCKR